MSVKKKKGIPIEIEKNADFLRRIVTFFENKDKLLTKIIHNHCNNICF